jgi:hypothetical protein
MLNIVFETFSNSIAIVKQSFKILLAEKELFLFPLISGVINVVLFIAILLWLFFLYTIGGNSGITMILGLISFLVYYLVSYFVIIFFNVGLVTCAGLRLNNTDPEFGDGIKESLKRIGPILGWAVISATVGLILKILSSGKRNFLGKIIAGILGMAWNFLTFFVIPVMVFEEKGPMAAMGRSKDLFVKTWGQNVVGRFSISLIMGLFALLGIIPLAISFLTGNIFIIITVFLFVFLYWVILALISMSLSGIFSTALYFYASTGKVPEVFDEKLVKDSYAAK